MKKHTSRTRQLHTHQTFMMLRFQPAGKAVVPSGDFSDEMPEDFPAG